MSDIAANMKAMCKLLEGDGHMTPIATRQILSVVERWETTPRTVTTVEELDALPARTLIREYDGFRRLKEINGMWLLCIQSGGIGESNEIELPATVLYVPEVPSD